MKSYKFSAVVLALAAIGLAAPAAHGQFPGFIPGIIPRIPSLLKKRPIGDGSARWLQAEVIHADSRSIIVREQADPRMIHTFTYSADIQAHMEQIENRGGYQNGDKVKILLEPGQTVALSIHGKPSKAL